MSDPFRPETNQQLLREARVGLTLLAITLGTFVYVAYYRISGSGQRLPDYVVNAPIAEAVWPGENPLALAEKKPNPKTLESQFGSLLASARDKFAIDPDTSPAARLRQRKRDYKDPIPSSDTARMPRAELPKQEEPDSVALAAYRGDAATEFEQNSFAPQTSRATSPKPSLDTNELRSTGEASDGETDFAPGLVNQAERPPQKQTSTMPVIVTPDGDRSCDFAPGFLRPYCETKTPQPSQSTDMAESGTSSNQFVANRLKSDDGEQQTTDDGAFSHEGSQIASQIVTSDIAADFAGQTPERTSPQPLERQISFNGKSVRPRAPVAIQENVPNITGNAKAVTSVDSVPVLQNRTRHPQEHLVKAGESFWSIAQEHYNDGRFFRALFEYNKQIVGSFENLLPGSTLTTPSSGELTKLWPELCPNADDSSPVSTNINDRIYVTQQGDTLFEIARQRFGQASRYLEIQNLNQIRLPESINHLSPLPAGIQLVLPLDVSQ